MHKLANLGIQTSRRFQFYSDSLKLGERVSAEIWGSPVSRQLLHLQQFSQNSENFGTLPYFELVSSFLDFNLLILALGSFEASSQNWVTINRLVSPQLND